MDPVVGEPSHKLLRPLKFFGDALGPIRRLERRLLSKEPATNLDGSFIQLPPDSQGHGLLFTTEDTLMGRDPINFVLGDDARRHGLEINLSQIHDH